MAKWKKDNGPTLWPINTQLISGVVFALSPRIDINAIMSDFSIKNNDSDFDNGLYCDIVDPRLEFLVSQVCQQLQRQTPISPDIEKGDLNTDVLRKVLMDEVDHIEDLMGCYVDVEYETIFGNTKITFGKDKNRPQFTIEVNCVQCLIVRDDDGEFINKAELDRAEFLCGDCMYKIDALMSYEITITKNGTKTRSQMKMSRQLEFVHGLEPLMFLEDGQEQQKVATKNLLLSICLDNVDIKECDNRVMLVIDGLEISVGSMEHLKARLVKLMFGRAKSKYHKPLELDYIYEKTEGSYQQEWDRETSKRFSKTISAAIKSLNSDFDKAFGTVGTKVFELKNKKVSINSNYLAPLEQKERKATK